MSNSRTNNSLKAEVNRSNIFASGSFKNVWKGTYTEGVRNGESCVAMEFKTGSVFEAYYFEEEIRIVERTQKIIDDFAASNVVRNGRIVLNTPGIWTYLESGHKCLVEPMIENSRNSTAILGGHN